MTKTLTLTQLAVYLNKNKRTLFRMIKDGRFDLEPIPKTKPKLWATENVEVWLRGRNDSSI